MSEIYVLSHPRILSAVIGGGEAEKSYHGASTSQTQAGSTWTRWRTMLRKKAIWVMVLFVPGSRGSRGLELSVERAVANERVSDG